MFTRQLRVTVDEKTWGSRRVPQAFKAAPALHTLDIAAALNMLGTLTLPSIVSPASPALFWAWLRYFLSVAANPDFRITRDFSELDPHQKGILSDDLGVAFSTQWLFDRLGGFKSIVDGRLFMLQFSHLLVSRKKVPKAKVGPSKAPDYVILDKSNRWHVLECKGTQSGPGFRDSFLKNAVAQKHVILLQGNIAGERIGAGLSISHEDQRGDSSLRIIDPDDDPALILNENQESEIKANAYRLSAARALGVVGLNDAALEMSLPPDAVKATDYLERVERRRVRQKTEDRSRRVSYQLDRRNLSEIQFRHQRYEGRTIELELPVSVNAPFNVIQVKQGVSHDFLQELSSLVSFFDEKLDTRLDSRLSDAEIFSESDGARTILTYGETLFSELILKKK